MIFCTIVPYNKVPGWIETLPVDLIKKFKNMKKCFENAFTCGVNQVEVNEGNVDYNRIYEYRDLTFGKPAKGNREINQAHIRSIYKNMDEDLLEEIRVDIETGYILDGNHRYFALEKYFGDGKTLTKPIRVIYAKRPNGMSVPEAIAYYNSHRKNWTAQDYIMSRKNQGDRYAVELADFCNSRRRLHTETIDKKTGKITLKPIMRYGGWFIKGCNCSPMFKNGNYAHTKAEFELGKTVYAEVEQILDAIGVTKTGTWFGEFVRAWRQVREEQSDKIAALPEGFNSLIPEFEKGNWVNENSLVNQLAPNMRNLEAVVNDVYDKVKKVA